VSSAARVAFAVTSRAEMHEPLMPSVRLADTECLMNGIARNLLGCRLDPAPHCGSALKFDP
jgi:hypothetical protein